MVEKDPNYCHDPDLIETGKKLGIIGSVINTALSIGEGMYNAVEVAEEFLIEQARRNKQNKANQPKTRLSKKQKTEIKKRSNR